MALILSGDTGVPASGMPAGSVIQTVMASTASPLSSSSSTYIDAGLTASITPNYGFRVNTFGEISGSFIISGSTSAVPTGTTRGPG